MNVPNRPEESEYAAYYRVYTQQVRAGDILEILRKEMQETQSFLSEISEDRANHAYAADKWSIKQVVGHLSDVERVFAVRALAFARREPSRLFGIEQDPYVEFGNFNRRSLKNIAAEFEAVRHSNILMFESFDDDVWKQTGWASDAKFSVRSIPYILAGHEIHHRHVIAERYL